MLKKTSVFALAMLFIFTSFTGCLGGDDDDDDSSTSYSEDLIIAFEVKDDYENPDENPQVMADYLTNELEMNVKLYPITSEGSIIEALRFGNAHIAFMDGHVEYHENIAEPKQLVGNSAASNAGETTANIKQAVQSTTTANIYDPSNTL